MTKEERLKIVLRDFYFSLAETIAMFEDCEKLCPTDNLLEMCETLSGVMAEQCEIIATLENLKSETEWQKVREEFRRPIVGERFYSSHLEALCDMMRLAKHMKDVSKAKDEVLTTLNQLREFDALPPLDVKLLRSTLDAIPRVKALNSDE